MDKHYKIILFTANTQVHEDKFLEDRNSSRLPRVKCGSGNQGTWFAMKDLALTSLKPFLWMTAPLPICSSQTTPLISPHDGEREVLQQPRLGKIASSLKGINNVPNIRGILKNCHDLPTTTSTQFDLKH
jgi:hypothetical protein